MYHNFSPMDNSSKHFLKYVYMYISQRSEVLQDLQMFLEYISGGSRTLVAAKNNLMVQFCKQGLGFLSAQSYLSGSFLISRIPAST